MMIGTVARRISALLVGGVLAVVIMGGTIFTPSSAEARYSEPIACTIANDSYFYAWEQMVASPRGSEAYYYWFEWKLYWLDYMGDHDCF
jgi:hypothetical protein